MTGELTASEYRELFRRTLPVASDADTRAPDLRTLFTPDSHRLALDPDSTVVRGGRGVGKTVWFEALQHSALRRVAAEAYQLPRLTRIQPHVGFGAKLEPERYPGSRPLAALLEDGANPADIWLTVLAVALGVDELRDHPFWPERVAWVRENPEPVEHAVARADRAAGEAGSTHLLLFDALDRLHPERDVTDALIGGVLRLALDLRTRTRHLRAKVFIRRDMFDDAQGRFADSSKLVANATDLTWSPANLYGLLFHHLGNGDGELSQRFRESVGHWREERGQDGEREAIRHVPPSEVIGDSGRQTDLFVRIAGRYMGADPRKGHTYTWLPNHLMDGRRQVSPRSFLRALTRAVEVTRANHANHQYALHYEGIRRGVQEASTIRVAEVSEDIPWVRTAVGDLEGTRVPTELEAIVDRWTERGLTGRLEADRSRQAEDDVRTGPRNPRSYLDLVAELVDLGIMSRRANGRIDIPDVYRIAFGIGRKGGVPRTRD